MLLYLLIEDCTDFNMLFNAAKAKLVQQPTNLSVGDTDEPLVHQLVPERVPRLTLHDVALGRFIS